MKKKSNLWLFWSCKLLKNCSEWSPWSVSFQGWQHPHPYETGVTEWFAESQNVSQIIWELESPDFNSCNAFTFYFEGVTQMTIPVIVVWIILVKITQSMVVVKFWFEIFFFFFNCTKMLHHTETFITHQQHVTATHADNPANCDPWWRPLRHMYFFKNNSTDLWLDVKKIDFWRRYINLITDLHGNKNHISLFAECVYFSL